MHIKSQEFYTRKAPLQNAAALLAKGFWKEER
jgi:hypothetical protein